MVYERKAFNVNSIITQMRDNLGIICFFSSLFSIFMEFNEQESFQHLQAVESLCGTKRLDTLKSSQPI